jgi:hypothetical protein
LLALAGTVELKSGGSLTSKLGSYARGRMVRGVDSKSATHKEIKAMLGALSVGQRKLGL